MSKLFTVFVAVIVAAGTAAAGVITNDFGSPPVGGCAFAPATVPVDGVNALGVAFAFTEGGNPSNLARYGDCIGTDTNLLAPLQDLVLDGPTDGTLTLHFAQPSSFLSFDVVFVGIGDSGGTVTLDGIPSSFSTTGNQGFSGFFSIGSFSGGGAPFTTAVITFDQSAADAFSFAMDNLVYNTPDLRGPEVQNPEPGSLALLGAGSLLLGLLRSRRRA